MVHSSACCVLPYHVWKQIANNKGSDRESIPVADRTPVRYPLRMKLRLLMIAILYIAMLTGGFGLLSVTSNHLLDLRLFVSSGQFHELIAAQVSDGLSSYLWFHGLDYLFIVLFYPFLRSLVLKAAMGGRLSIVGGWAAVLAGLFDLIENVGVDWALLSYPRLPSWIATMVPIATLLKFLGILVTLIIVLLALPKRLSRTLE